LFQVKKPRIAAGFLFEEWKISPAGPDYRCWSLSFRGCVPHAKVKKVVAEDRVGPFRLLQTDAVAKRCLFAHSSLYKTCRMNMRFSDASAGRGLLHFLQ